MNHTKRLNGWQQWERVNKFQRSRGLPELPYDGPWGAVEGHSVGGTPEYQTAQKEKRRAALARFLESKKPIYQTPERVVLKRPILATHDETRKEED